MKDRIQNFLVDFLTYLSYYLAIGFVEWELSVEHWSSWSRLALIALVIYNIGKQLNEEQDS